jgi:ubiquinone/menaquinone biosynthesis C-methylase UbiE
MQIQQKPGQPATDIKSRMALLQMSSGYWISQSLYAAAKLGIADLVKDDAQNCEQLAEATNTRAPALYRLLRALASVGVFAEQEPGCFTITPIAQGLRSDIPGSMRDSILLGGGEYYHAWGNLLDSLKTGENGFEQKYGMPVFDYYQQHTESGAIFDRAMKNISEAIKPAIVNGYDFSNITKLVDVGGGNGSLMAAIVKANPQLQGILFDQATAIATASEVFAVEGVSDRCEVIAGNFFQSVPKGGDAYLLKYVLHNWDDQQAIAILRNCHHAMQENSKLLVVEQVIPPGNESFSGKLIDLHMLVTLGGRERTSEEYQKLFESAGFKLNRIIPTRSNVSIIEGMTI